ncbi:Rab family GTPase [Planoprotostelium fungivorum]|uniref:Rab family GTPase n=1 Tax=Planoprotostelium fungivorum TaxID=1890364 RepID=A0A2P6NRD7_9EUKA|nr:Rab family GTPase [Planoprotostelium fungivorum]
MANKSAHLGVANHYCRTKSPKSALSFRMQSSVPRHVQNGVFMNRSPLRRAEQRCLTLIINYERGVEVSKALTMSYVSLLSEYKGPIETFRQPMTGYLAVKVIEAESLPIRSTKPYVKVGFTAYIKTKPSKYNPTHPVWEELLEWNNITVQPDHKLKFSIYNKGLATVAGDENMGECYVSTNHILANELVERWHDLVPGKNGKPTQGRVHVRVNFQTKDVRVTVLVVSDRQQRPEPPITDEIRPSAPASPLVPVDVREEARKERVRKALADEEEPYRDSDGETASEDLPDYEDSMKKRQDKDARKAKRDAIRAERMARRESLADEYKRRLEEEDRRWEEERRKRTEEDDARERRFKSNRDEELARHEAAVQAFDLERAQLLERLSAEKNAREAAERKIHQERENRGDKDASDRERLEKDRLAAEREAQMHREMLQQRNASIRRHKDAFEFEREGMARERQILLQRLEAERLAREEAERRAKDEVDHRMSEKMSAEETERRRQEITEREAMKREMMELAERLKSETRAREEAEKRAQEEEMARIAKEKERDEEKELLRRQEVEREEAARERAEILVRLEAERQARLEAEKKMIEYEEANSSRSAYENEREALAKEKALLMAKLEVERKAREEAERKAREEAELRDKEMAARERAELMAKLEAETKARQEAERRAKEEKDAQNKREKEATREREEAALRAEEAEKAALVAQLEMERQAREMAEKKLIQQREEAAKEDQSGKNDLQRRDDERSEAQRVEAQMASDRDAIRTTTTPPTPVRNRRNTRASVRLEENGAEEEDQMVTDEQGQKIRIHLTKFRVVDGELRRQPAGRVREFSSDSGYIIIRVRMNAVQNITDDMKTEESQNQTTNKIYTWIGHKTDRSLETVLLEKVDELASQYPTTSPVKKLHQGLESKEFLSSFQDATIHYTQEKESRKNRLMRIIGKKNMRVYLGKVSFTYLNAGQSCVLDTGHRVYQWIGKQSTAANRRRANEILRALVSERTGKAQTVIVDQGTEDAEFWDAMGGRGPVSDPNDDDDYVDTEQLAKERQLYRLDVQPDGQITFTLVAAGIDLDQQHLDTKEVFLYDAGVDLFVWVGKQAAPEAKKNCMDIAAKHAQQKGRVDTPITKQLEGGESDYFKVAFSF